MQRSLCVGVSLFGRQIRMRTGMNTSQGVGVSATPWEPAAGHPAASTSVLDARFWFDRTPWRLAAGWTVLAAVLAAQPLAQTLRTDLVQVVLLFLLADSLWGGVWGGMVAPDTLPAIQGTLKRSRIWLPYLHTGSPAAHLFGLEGPGMLAVVMRATVPAVLLALLVAALLSQTAVWLTLVVVALSVAGWLHRHVELVPLTVLYSLVTVALPWALVVEVMGGEVSPGPVAWALLWTLHAWGGVTVLERPAARGGLMALALAQAGVSLLLILLRVPLWLGPTAILWLPTWLAAYRGVSLERVRFWWLAALLTTALAISGSSL